MENGAYPVTLNRMATPAELDGQNDKALTQQVVTSTAYEAMKESGEMDPGVRDDGPQADVLNRGGFGI